MNCKQANTRISIRNVLESFSLFPSKDNSKAVFYFAFDREKKHPVSLSILQRILLLTSERERNTM